MGFGTGSWYRRWYVPAARARSGRTRGGAPQEGFNAYAQKLLRSAGFSHTMSCQATDTDRIYQRVVSYLVHPRSPVQRLLVAHQLGTGKTISMLRILDLVRC